MTCRQNGTRSLAKLALKADWLSISNRRTKFSDIKIKISSYRKKYAFKNVVCETLAIIYRPQWGKADCSTTVENLYNTIYYSKYFIELNFDKSTQYVALWTHKRHPIPRLFGRAMECLLWVLQQKLTVLKRVSTVCYSMNVWTFVQQETKSRPKEIFND